MVFFRKRRSSLETFDELIKTIKNQVDLVDQGLAEGLERLLNENPELRTKDPAVLEAFLESPDPNLRCGALCLLMPPDNPSLHVANLSEKLALTDPDEKVRSVAIRNVEVYYARTKNLPIKEFLARIVLNERETPKVREVAYRSLVSVANLPIEKWPSLLKFDLAVSVDWKLVQSCLAAPSS